METQLIGGRTGSENRWTWVRVPQPIAARRTPVTIIGAVIAAVALLLATQLLTGGASANPGSVIDFEGLAEGTIVTSVSSGSGISGDVVSGSVSVFGSNPDIGGGATNTAMIFDGTCGGGCSGGDVDLEFPGQMNILIVSEDLDTTDPDDNIGGRLDLDFLTPGFGPGTVFVNSLVVMDVESSEAAGTIELFAGGPGGVLVTTVNVPVTGNNGKATVLIGDVGDFLRVNFIGSGAIDDIDVDIEVITGRMTGGGSVFKMDGARVTRGFEIRCDLSEPNRLQVNWPGGNKFHLTWLTAATCTDDPAIIQDPPAADFDTFIGDGIGRLNGVDGATIHFVFVDAGEPGKNDTALIQITDTGGTVVLDVSGFIDVGNLQAH